jgi:toxin YoeB
MIYKVILSEDAEEDAERLERREPQAHKKLLLLLDELWVHPTIGTGHPKQMGANLAGLWSRRITDKHRLVYKIDKEELVVTVHSTYGHYGDK